MPHYLVLLCRTDKGMLADLQGLTSARCLLVLKKSRERGYARKKRGGRARERQRKRRRSGDRCTGVQGRKCASAVNMVRGISSLVEQALVQTQAFLISWEFAMYITKLAQMV